MVEVSTTKYEMIATSPESVVKFDPEDSNPTTSLFKQEIKKNKKKVIINSSNNSFYISIKVNTVYFITKVKNIYH